MKMATPDKLQGLFVVKLAGLVAQIVTLAELERSRLTIRLNLYQQLVIVIQFQLYRFLATKNSFSLAETFA